MTISDLSDMVNRLSGGNSGDPEFMLWEKYVSTGGNNTTASVSVAGQWSSLWRHDGWPSAGAVPGAVDFVTTGTAGAMPLTVTSSFGQVICGAGWQTRQVGTLMVYDRLLHCGGLNATTTTAQTVTGDAQRYQGLNGRSVDSALGNMLFVEIYTIIGTSLTTATVTYHGADSNNYTSPPFSIGGGTLREAQRMIPVPLARGTAGAESPIGFENVDLVASTGTAGNFGVTLFKPLLALPVPLQPNYHTIFDALFNMGGQLPKILTDACLFWVINSQTTSFGSAVSRLTFTDQ